MFSTIHRPSRTRFASSHLIPFPATGGSHAALHFWLSAWNVPHPTFATLAMLSFQTGWKGLPWEPSFDTLSASCWSQSLDTFNWVCTSLYHCIWYCTYLLAWLSFLLHCDLSQCGDCAVLLFLCPECLAWHYAKCSVNNLENKWKTLDWHFINDSNLHLFWSQLNLHLISYCLFFFLFQSLLESSVLE